MYSNEQCWHAVFVEEDVNKFDLVAQRVEVWFGQQHWELFRRSLQGFVGMLPKEFHIIPVFNDAVAHWVLHLEQSLPFRV